MLTLPVFCNANKYAKAIYKCTSTNVITLNFLSIEQPSTS